MSEVHYSIDIGNMYEAIVGAGITIHNNTVLTSGNSLTSDNLILSSTTGLTSSVGVDLIINSNLQDLSLTGNNTTFNTTLSTTINTTDMISNISGNKLENIVGTNTINSNGITLDSSNSLILNGTNIDATANNGNLSLTSNIGSISLIESTNQDGINIITNGITITVNSVPSDITVPSSSNDIVSAINNLYTLVGGSSKQRATYILSSIPILTTTDAFGTFPVHPIHWNWIENRYGVAAMDYQDGILLTYIETEDVLYEIRNASDDSLIQTGTFTIGFNSITYATLPTSNTNIYIDVRSVLGTGRILGLSLEFTAQNVPS